MSHPMERVLDELIAQGSKIIVQLTDCDPIKGKVMRYSDYPGVYQLVSKTLVQHLHDDAPQDVELQFIFAVKDVIWVSLMLPMLSPTQRTLSPRRT